MSQKFNPLGLDCPLIPHLERLSSTSGGADATFTGAFLAHLGYVQNVPADPGVEDTSALLESLVGRGDGTVWSRVAGHCSRCELAAVCHVGDIVLEK